jgi:signal transduction histidine kinase/HAMP domain-containing protein
MDYLFPLFSDRPFPYPPQGILGWIVWVLWWVVLIYLIRRWHVYDSPLKGGKRWLLFGLLVAQLIFSLTFGIRIPAWGALALPELPLGPRGPILMLFSAVPWFLAAGFLGPFYAAIVAVIPGILVGLLDSHNPYFFLEMALMGVMLGAMLRQRYRTPFYRLLRHPLFAAFMLMLVYALIFIVDATFLPGGSLVSRLDYALSNLRSVLVAFGASLFIGGIAGEIFYLMKVRGWGSQGSLEPSPAERSLQARFFYTMVPLGLAVLIALIVGDWYISGRAARQMLHDRMSNAAGTAVDGIPFFLEAGQDLIQQISDDPRLYQASSSEIPDILRENLRRVPFFRQLYLLDVDENLVGSFPDQGYDLTTAPLDESKGYALAKNGVRVQSYAIPPRAGAKAAQVTFISNVLDGQDNVRGVLIGRVDLESNPFTQPVITSLNSLDDIDGTGYLLDERGRILYNPSSDQLMSPYTGQTSPEDPFSDQTASDGRRSLVYYRQAIGRPWAASMWVPASQGQQLSLEFATPLLLIVLLIAVATAILAKFAIQGVTTSMQNLAVESDRIAQGQLDHSLNVEGQDEVGQLRRSFEQMRQSLKARLDELNQLLEVSQGVASSLDLEESLQPVLIAVVASGAGSARIVLDPATFPDLNQAPGGVPTRLGLGPSTTKVESLDDQILELGRGQDQIILTNPARVRILRFDSGTRRPEALASFSMRHENQYYGVLWVAYDESHTFSDEEIRYLRTLTSQAALAVANANLFLSAEVGRQRLAAILESTPDPILVTDAQNRLLLANPAVRKAFSSVVTDFSAGQDVEKVIPNIELVRLLKTDATERQPVEITLPDERTYLAIASNTLMNGQRGGRVCVMRDITQFKELDALKSEFVSTVSHDLRSPLTLIRGYATMLQMVGELNDQQSNYVHKIVLGIENMSRLVNNLLDLGRIEAGVGLQLELIPVRDVVEQVISTLQHQAAQKQIDLVVNFPEDAEPIVEADQALIQQALQNLVENAIKYTESGGRVEVSFEVRQDNAVLKVADNGIGIAPVDQARLFERFYRVARRGAMQQRGTGLGLAIVKSIAERHGGRVWVESQLGKGSTFYFMIPLRQSKALEGGNS